MICSCQHVYQLTQMKGPSSPSPLPTSLVVGGVVVLGEVLPPLLWGTCSKHIHNKIRNPSFQVGLEEQAQLTRVRMISVWSNNDAREYRFSSAGSNSQKCIARIRMCVEHTHEHTVFVCMLVCITIEHSLVTPPPPPTSQCHSYQVHWDGLQGSACTE